MYRTENVGQALNAAAQFAHEEPGVTFRAWEVLPDAGGVVYGVTREGDPKPEGPNREVLLEARRPTGEEHP